MSTDAEVPDAKSPLPDLLIRGGTVLDPASGFEEPSDVAICDGRITAIAPDLPATAGEVFDARGMLVTPGLVDLHVHAYHDVNIYGFDVDPICLASGVTTAVDAGSSGPVNFPGFRRFVAARAETRLLAFVCIAQNGVTRGEMFDLSYADVEGAAGAVLDHPEVGIGIKVRLARSCVGEGASHAREVLRLAIAAGDAAQAPLMIHIGETPIGLSEIVDTLRPGDIVTHCYTPQAEGALDAAGRVRDGLLRGKARGVRFDVGHASGHMSFDIVRRCMADGLVPDTISTDLHVRNYLGDLIVDLPTTVTKFLALGMPLRDAIAAVTSGAAAAIGREDLGRLEVGGIADVAILELVDEPLWLRDSTGAELRHDGALRARATVRAGVLHHVDPGAPGLGGTRERATA